MLGRKILVKVFLKILIKFDFAVQSDLYYEQGFFPEKSNSYFRAILEQPSIFASV